MGIFTTWWFWVIIGIAFGIPLLSWLIKLIISKTGALRRRNSAKNADHVRKAVDKYNKKKEKEG